MYKDKKITALIPARAGSKGLKAKNLAQLSGKPLIAWTIEAAKKSAYLDRIAVSTDDQKIAEVSRKFGAQVPFIRSKELARDESPCLDVVLDYLSFTNKQSEFFDILVLLQPTSPLRDFKDIDRAIELLFEKKAKAIVSVSEAEHHPLKSNLLPDNHCLKDFIKPGNLNKNRQELGKFYRENGAVYVADCDYLNQEKSFYGQETFAYIMPQERSIDIDSIIDLKLAESLKNG